MPPSDDTLELSIVMPCLNEAETVGQCIATALAFLASAGVCGEVLIADNGSADGSQEIATKAGARVVNVAVRGYGAALMGGIAAARGRYVAMADADGSYDLGALGPFLSEVRAGADLVMGNRFSGRIEPGAMPPLHRYLGNPVLTGIGRLLFRSPCGDFHCGLRCFRREAILGLDLQTTGMEFASEMVVKASLRNLKIAEVPITLSPDGRTRPPHLRSWRDGWRHLRFLLLYSPRWLFLYPGLLLMLIGIAGGAWLLPEPRRMGGVTLDIHTLLYCAAFVIVGYQAVVFAAFTTVFAVSEKLLPESPALTKAFRYVTLEVGLVAGTLLTLAGLAGTLYAFGGWGENSFGPLTPSATMRIVIPSVTAVILGSQTNLSSFYLSVLGLKRK
jgi:glycosyltransferase involved in cell wall biosynthesis